MVFYAYPGGGLEHTRMLVDFSVFEKRNINPKLQTNLNMLSLSMSGDFASFMVYVRVCVVCFSLFCVMV